MGVHKNISHEKFPRQGTHKGRRVDVCFNYDTNNQLKGRIVRDDAEEPYRMIIQLDDGRYVLGVECQYHLVEDQN